MYIYLHKHIKNLIYLVKVTILSLNAHNKCQGKACSGYQKKN